MSLIRFKNNRISNNRNCFKIKLKLILNLSIYILGTFGVNKLALIRKFRIERKNLTIR